eukprot:TRINITY_DN17830_c0_g1_i1.p1 TRINITY_DN17830_c0_g1~~TRINITY_DN17830_c0_g1_i1.p1  ORF type:complete len:465 (+),score=82.76 TRINITY_DN17830_c0_g1_i1:34-1428(+)
MCIRDRVSTQSTGSFQARRNTTMGDYLQIHKKWYNVKEFNHPGGTTAMGLGLGRDATALFESHHPFTSRAKLKAILAKYEVSEDEVKRLNLLTFEEKSKDTREVFDWGVGGIDREFPPFEKEVKEEVYDYFKKESERRGISLLEATKATPVRWAEMMFDLVITLATVPFLVMGYWWALFVTPVLFWLLAANSTHDAMHFSVSSNPRINDLFSYAAPFTTSPLMWYHQHVIGHHAYPNVSRKDPDLAHAPGLMRVHDSINWKPAHKYQLISTAIIWTLGATLYMTLVPLKVLVKGAYNRVVILQRVSALRIVRHLIGRLICASLLWSWPWFVFPVWQAIIWCTVPMFIHSLCFMGSTQLNHLTPQNAVAYDSEFYKHQVVTSHSFTPDSQFWFTCTGGLNLQIEHHLFPTVNHCHLPKIHKMVKALCIKHNVPYHESATIGEGLWKYVSHLIAMGSKPVKTEKTN